MTEPQVTATCGNCKHAKEHNSDYVLCVWDGPIPKWLGSKEVAGLVRKCDDEPCPTWEPAGERGADDA